MKFVKNNDGGFWELVNNKGNVLAQVVPWVSKGYAVFIYGKMTVVEKNLVRAKKYARACV